MIKLHKFPNPKQYHRGSPIRLGPNVGVVLFRFWHWTIVRWDYWIW